MILREERFKKVLQEELNKRFYTFIEVMDKEGASGFLYKVYSKNDDEPRVVKVYKDPIDNVNLDLYKKDAKKLRKYKDKNIAQVYEVGSIAYKEDKYFFIIQEYINGKSLDEIEPHIFWENNKYNERIKIFSQVLNTTEVFRAKYDIHNDLHLGNLILTLNKKIKIIDFGSSKVSYISAQPDLDLYLIKKNLMEFFFKPKEILNFKKKIDLETIDFIQLKQFIIENISNSSSRFRVLSKVLPDNYTNEIDSIKQNLYEKIKINDLKLIFSFFPIEPYRDLFPLDDHMKFFLERKIPLRAKLDNPIFPQFRQFEITQDDFYFLSNNNWMGNNLILTSNGIIIYGIYVNGKEAPFYGYQFKFFPIKEILNCFLGFLDYVHDIYKYIDFDDVLMISLEIKNISDYYLFKEMKFEPAINPEKGKFKQKGIKKIAKAYNIQEFSNPDQKLKITRDFFNPILRAFERIDLPIYDEFNEFYNSIV